MSTESLSITINGISPLLMHRFPLMPIDEYSIDSRRVVIKATSGSIVRHRPRIDDWSVSFELDYDTLLLSIDQVREIVDNGGRRIGVLDFRPEKKGPYGRFMVTRWE